MNFTCVFIGTVEFQYRSEHLRGNFPIGLCVRFASHVLFSPQKCWNIFRLCFSYDPFFDVPLIPKKKCTYTRKFTRYYCVRCTRTHTYAPIWEGISIPLHMCQWECHRSYTSFLLPLPLLLRKTDRILYYIVRSLLVFTFFILSLSFFATSENFMLLKYPYSI